MRHSVSSALNYHQDTTSFPPFNPSLSLDPQSFLSLRHSQDQNMTVQRDNSSQRRGYIDNGTPSVSFGLETHNSESIDLSTLSQFFAEDLNSFEMDEMHLPANQNTIGPKGSALGLKKGQVSDSTAKFWEEKQTKSNQKCSSLNSCGVKGFL